MDTHGGDDLKTARDQYAVAERAPPHVIYP